MMMLFAFRRGRPTSTTRRRRATIPPFSPPPPTVRDADGGGGGGIFVSSQSRLSKTQKVPPQTVRGKDLDILTKERHTPFFLGFDVFEYKRKGRKRVLILMKIFMCDDILLRCEREREREREKNNR